MAQSTRILVQPLKGSINHGLILGVQVAQRKLVYLTLNSNEFLAESSFNLKHRRQSKAKSETLGEITSMII